MEKHLERRREQEPKEYVRSVERLWLRVQNDKNRVASLPHVIKFDDVPWRQSAQSYRKAFFDCGPQERLTAAPISSIGVHEQIIPPGGKSGRHRHYFEAIFYIVEGRGYEIHDGERYPWEAGDVMIVPTYCVHQHFNSSSSEDARLFFSVPAVYEVLMIAGTEQIEMHADYNFPAGAPLLYSDDGQVVGYKSEDGEEVRFSQVDLELQRVMAEKHGADDENTATNTYEKYVTTLTEQGRARQSAPHVIKERDCIWENTRMGRLKYLIHPYSSSGLYAYDAFIQEIPPGGRSGRHRHVSEEVHKILEGKGFDVHDGKRWDWEVGDLVCIPVNTVHQHFNADSKRPARFVAFQSRLPHHLGQGGVQHIEDAATHQG